MRRPEGDSRERSGERQGERELQDLGQHEVEWVSAAQVWKGGWGCGRGAEEGGGVRAGACAGEGHGVRGSWRGCP